MKIALFVPSWPPGSVANGIITYAAYIVPALQRLGHKVYLLTFLVSPHNATDDKDPWTIDLRRYSPKETAWDRVKFRLSPSTVAFNRKSAAIEAAIRELVAKEKLDVFEIEESFGWSFAISRLNLLPVVVRLHGPWFLNGRSGDPAYGSDINCNREKWEGRGIGDAPIVTSPSANVIRAVKKHYDLNLIESRVIPNPIQAAFAPDTWDLATCRRDTLLFVGSIDKRKGADVVLRAFAGLAARHPRLRLTVAGPDRGIEVTGEKILSYEQFVRANIPEPIRSQIEFLGQVNNSDIMRLRKKCFATIVASRYEIMPYSVLEAMSLGCPLIATAVGGIPELITDHRNGLLVPSEDLAAMTDACEELLSDNRLAARLGHQSWQDCRDLYSPDHIAEQTIATYTHAITEFKLRSSGLVYNRKLV